ncbi:MAG: hypothetical protein A3J28_16790 [Acidobacteria bacterium RIFCSPLOWO2_12_FULL_60_22]|nr:MAG: hypothetical protein A3J28_16790 [Acidobacteria bacterium RIFCSPLOWO2_12_FULL_60_22]
MQREELEREMLALPPGERAELAHELIASLEAFDNSDVEGEWLKEAESRYAAYRQGTLSGRPAEEVFKSAKDRLR